MLIQIPKLLNSDQVTECRRALDQVEWVDDRVTAAHQGGKAGTNQQAPEGHPITRRLGDMVLAAIELNPLFMAAALPLKVVPPLFNRYTGGQKYGNHVDGAIRPVPSTPHQVRTDLSVTIFLSAPESYDGGELVVEDATGVHRVKLPAGDMVLYSGASIHRVEPVTRGARVASFFWVQSMVRRESQRTLLFDLDAVIQKLAHALPEQDSVRRLTGIYHNLLREWAEV